MEYFASCSNELFEFSSQRFYVGEKPAAWPKLSEQLREQADRLTEGLISCAASIIDNCKKSALTDQADIRTLTIAVKTMRAALHLERYQYYDTELLHDEGQVLGVRTAEQRTWPIDVQEATIEYEAAHKRVMQIIEFVAPGASFVTTDETPPNHKYRPNTAFIMMWMDSSKAFLEDVREVATRVFAKFGILAVRADDIEHSGNITDRVLKEIAESEFLFADLTGERPNVYYEVGYAHALRKRVILFRQEGTGIHFDLAGYNCPSYRNMTDLENKLTKRLETLTNKTMEIEA